MGSPTFRILFYVKKGSGRANGCLPLMYRLTVDGEIKRSNRKPDIPKRIMKKYKGCPRTVICSPYRTTADATSY